MLNDKAMAYIRVSIPKYNEDVYLNNKLYMNPQLSFRNSELTSGQKDDLEAMVSKLRMKLSCVDGSTDRFSLDVTSFTYNVHAYIFCVYVVPSGKLQFDKENNTYHYIVPWSYIESFWKENEKNEMLITPCTQMFKDIFDVSSNMVNIGSARGLIYYDLDEKLQSLEYIKSVFNDPSQVVFHKQKEHIHENEYRFAVFVPERPQHYELPLINTDEMTYYAIELKEKHSVELVFKGLSFSNNGEIVNYSRDMEYRLISEY